jgi:hypothetical protein
VIVIDIECYTNYFLFSALDLNSKRIAHIESLNDSALDTDKIKRIMLGNTTISFNGNNYDLPMIAHAIGGATNAQLKALSDKIIVGKAPSWKLGVDVPKGWDHIDLIEVAPGQASLKIYGGRMHAPKMQDLPLPPSAKITERIADKMRSYCENDLHTTAMLYGKLTQQIELRAAMSDQYGMDLRSKSDAQIAETVIVSEIEQETKRKLETPEIPSGHTFRYRDPQIVEFQTDQLRDVFKRILATPFELSANGSVSMPEWLKDTRIKLGQSEYQMGIGGLHSCEKRRCVRKGANELLLDLDVASYYPNIILQQGLAPKTLGDAFLKVYGSLVDRRLAAKKAGDKVSADTLKICVNGSFGKLGSKYSKLYSPDLLIQTTITGQLALLMLIEALELRGVSVISANTDGIVIHTDKRNADIIDECAFDWMMTTSYELERTEYVALASRDVNTYVAVKPDGSTKGKGAFASGGLMKNPDQPIIYKAVADYLANGTCLQETIETCGDITQFVTVRKVNGGAKWRGKMIGKAVRYYYSTSAAHDECIHYATNGNRVPKSAGAKPLMQLPDEFPQDIDYHAYHVDAEKLLCEVGL